MRYTLYIFLILLFTSSCVSSYLTDKKRQDITIGKSLETKTERLQILTSVEKYSPSKRWYYGSIKICNQTNDTVRFSFRQFLLAEGDTLRPKYNLFPVSYTSEAFDIRPKSCRTWTVAWAIKKDVVDFKNFEIIPDTSVIVSYKFYKGIIR
jgi:hypothetical protein